MKRYLIKLLSLFALVIIAANCDETEDFEFLPTERNFEIISPTDGASLILDRANEQNIALTIIWSDNASGSGSYSPALKMRCGSEKLAHMKKGLPAGTWDKNSLNWLITLMPVPWFR